MTPFEEELLQRLELLRAKSLYRHLRPVASSQGPRLLIDNQEKLNFSSNDYLGLAAHPRLKNAAARAAQDEGAGSGASRLVCGSLRSHHELEESIARFKNVEAALVFSSGYATALGTIPALLGKEDIVILDKRVHASVVDAARLSGAQLRVFAHNDPADLQRILVWCDRQRSRSSETRILIITESLFSMDGDAAPLRDIADLKEKHGAWLMVDEAHAVGLFGSNRRGLVEELGVESAVDIQMGTLGKAVGAAGGYIAGTRALVDYLVNKARSFIFSTALTPATSAAARAGIEVIASPEGETLLNRLRANVALFENETGRKGVALHSPIYPWIVGEEQAALSAAAELYDRGIYVPAIRYPTVARGQARLRFTFSAAHSDSDIKKLAKALAES